MYYKYLPIERLSYLNDELLRFTQPADLNDPFECRPQMPNHQDFLPALKLIGKSFKKDGKTATEYVDNNFTPEWLDKFYNEAYEKTNQDIGILSLSRKWNNSLMWSHYTNAHKGFCIGFNSNHSFFTDYLSNDGNTSKHVLDVIYSEKRVKIPTSHLEPKLLFQPHITKSIDWRYEDEVRVIATLNSADESKKQLPFDIFLFKVPHEAISEIVMGVNISEEEKTIIEKFGVKNQVSIYKAKISNTKFNLDRDLFH